MIAGYINSSIIRKRVIGSTIHIKVNTFGLTLDRISR